MTNWSINSIWQPGTDVVTEILKTRGISDIDTYLNPPDLQYWAKNLDRDFLSGLKSAKNVIKKAISENRTIVIHGDYDADGICATTILFDCIKNELNYDNTLWFVPNRFDHGYGLSMESIKAILAKVTGKTLFITVDSGVTSYDEVKYLKENGHDVIITDHHQTPEVLPPADALVWYDRIVGASIAWFVARALGSKNPQSIAFAALATVTDLQPLLELNRTIVTYGLEVLRKTPPLGLKVLLETADKTVEDVSTYELGWVIGPRINATGRIEDAGIAVDLLLATDESSARKSALALSKLNTDRQDKTQEMFEKAQVDETKDLPLIIVSKDDDYHEGIIGLVAAKLVQKYFRPSIVVCTEGELAKASVRSIPGVNIIEFLRRFDELFESLGGHPMAAGFSIKKKNLPKLEQLLVEHAIEVVTPDLLVPTISIDMQLPVNEITTELVEEISKMEPFGLGNAQPVFMSDGLKVANIDVVGKNKEHVSLRFVNVTNNFYKGIMFGGAERVDELALGQQIEVVYNLKPNLYKGRLYIDLGIKDFKLVN